MPSLLCLATSYALVLELSDLVCLRSFAYLNSVVVVLVLRNLIRTCFCAKQLDITFLLVLSNLI